VKERIQKILANAGVESRRHVEEMVRQGRVAVNGKVRTDLPILIDPEHDRVTVDDEPIRIKPRGGGAGGGRGPAQRLYFLLNKPRGVYSTNVAQGAQKRAIDLLPHDLPGRVYPVGRLDADSKGLLLMTNDGELTNKLTHPRYGVAKTYRATVEGSVKLEAIRELEKGVWLADKDTGKGFKTRPSRIHVVHRDRERTVLDITLKEGHNRQVRRMLVKIGHKVRDLVRVKMGPLTLQGLAPGKFRPLTPREIKDLHAVTHRKPEPPPGRRAEGDGRKRPTATEPAVPADDNTGDFEDDADLTDD
jgi:23S rRNA pseudouridine2605 synthase